MTTYTPLGGKQALSLSLPHFSASWPVIGSLAGAIILLGLVAALAVAFAPRHGARHAHGPRHARPETAPANGKKGVVTTALEKDPALLQARQPIAAETRRDNSTLKRWARA